MQPEQPCLEHCDFCFILSIRNAWRKRYLAQRQSLLEDMQYCVSCIVERDRAARWPGSYCHWKHTSTGFGNRDVQVKEMEKRLVVLVCKKSMKGS